MKKIIFLSLIATFIASCWTSTDDTLTTKYDWTWFSMNIPKSWVKVEQSGLPSTKNWKIELALTSSEINAWFANNLVILSEDIVNKTTSSKYSIANYVRTTWSVNSYTKLSETNYTFADKDETIIYTFEAKYSNETPKRKFIQTAKICWNKAYLMTIWINLDNNATSKYEDLFKSFECKNQ